MPLPSPVLHPLRVGFPLLLLAGLLLFVSACNLHYRRARALELQNRWEEAAIEYHLALLEDPGIPEFKEALKRSNLVVAQENLKLYRKYLAQKQYRKAHQRLVDAARQNPDLQEAQAETAKWLQVLVAGQVKFEFQSLHSNLSLADEIKLMVRMNTPNPGEVISAEINLDTGTFFVEDLLYDRPAQLLTYYTLNSIGVNLKYGRSVSRSFTSNDFQGFLNFRIPVLDKIEGRMALNGNSLLQLVHEHRKEILEPDGIEQYWEPAPNPHYTLNITDQRIRVASRPGQGQFTPRFLYLNRKDRRLFVDFGKYEVRLDQATRKWGLTRLSLNKGDYFSTLSQNIALEPYFFYREGVFAYEPNDAG